MPRGTEPLRAIAIGVVGMTIYPLALTRGEVSVTGGTASVLVNLSPIFTALIAGAMLRERLPWSSWAGILIAFAGAAIIAASEKEGVILGPGSLLILVAALAQAVQFVLSKSLLRTYDPLSMTTIAIWSGTAGDLIFCRGLLAAIRTAPVASTLAVVYLGIFPTVLATVSWSHALSRVDASLASAFLYLVPPVAIAIEWIWLGETPALVTIAGAALAIGGVMIVKAAAHRGNLFASLKRRENG